MSDAWAELQALKSRKKRLEERKKERQDILNSGLVVPSNISGLPTTASQSYTFESKSSPSRDETQKSDLESSTNVDLNVEEYVLRCLTDVAINLPLDSRQIQDACNKTLISESAKISHDQVVNLLEKFAVQQLISINERILDDGTIVEVLSAEHTKLLAMTTTTPVVELRKRKAEETLSDDSEDTPAIDEKKPKENDVLSLLSLASTREKENKRIGEEIRELLSRPSAKEKTLAEQFRSQGGTTVQEFCPHGTKSECRRVAPKNKPCGRLHFRKIIQSHTDETLGDCSFLNTCFHMETCKYVHYEVDSEKVIIPTSPTSKGESPATTTGVGGGSTALLTATTIPALAKLQTPATPKSVLHPPQWIHCDLRFFDMTVLGKFSVIMADPPWDIHMELPYGTLSDDEMRHLNIPALQDEGLIFLWVTGRAMELGRECLQLWGYERVDELIWVKTNQLQRIIRTGRTGHWLNHGKEHCLVGMKGNPPVNRGLDCDVIVAEVRATSHKPDEVYGIIERLSPGTRKIELFGRRHNIQPNWMTLGNQLDGVHLVDEELMKRFYTRYPDGNCFQTSS